MRAMDLAATILMHGRLRLEPFADHHLPGLTKAGADPAIWTHMPYPVRERGYSDWFAWLRREQEAGRWLPFAVFADDTIVGQSCYLNPRPADGGVEIGGTWYAPAAQATFVNPTAKLLLIGHAFACGAERVELKTDAINARSRAAMLKLGCSFEGIHRHHMRRPDGSWRDTAWYSVLREEWDEVRAGLEARVVGLG